MPAVQRQRDSGRSTGFQPVRPDGPPEAHVTEEHRQDACATEEAQAPEDWRQDARVTEEHRQDARATEEHRQDACATEEAGCLCHGRGTLA